MRAKGGDVAVCGVGVEGPPHRVPSAWLVGSLVPRRQQGAFDPHLLSPPALEDEARARLADLVTAALCLPLVPRLDVP